MPLRFFFASACLILGILPLALTAPDEVDERAEARLKRLAEQAASPTDKDKLRSDLLGFMRAYGGTSYGIEAAGLLMKLPSPLDKLDPGNIPEVEKFSWQPKELVAVLGEHRGRQGNLINGVAYSPDGKLIASAGGYLRVWDAQTMRLKHLMSPGYYLSSCAFSRNSKVLVAGNTSGGLHVWDLQPDDKSPVLRFSVTVGSTSINGIAFSPNGRTIACACSDNATRLYDVTGKEAKELAVVTGHTGLVYTVVYSTDGKLLATGSADKTIRIWNATSDIPTEKATIEKIPTGVTALSFNPVGNTLAAGCEDGKLFLFAMPSTGKPRASFEAKGSGTVNALSFSSTGNTLAAACNDATIRLWNVSLPKPVERARLDGHFGMCKGVAYSPDNKILASGGYDWVCRTWDLNALPKPKERFMPAGHLGTVTSSAFLHDGSGLVSGSIDSNVRIWDLARPGEPKTRNFLKTENTKIQKVVVSPDGKTIAAGGDTKTIRQWDAASGRTLRNCINEGSTGYHLAYTPDSKQLVVAGNGQKEAVLFDAGLGSSARTFSSHEVGINGLGIAPDGKMLATCSGTYLYDKMGKIVLDKSNNYVYNDCTIKLWDLENAKELYAIKSHKIPVYQLAFNPDNKSLLSSAYENSLRRYEVADPVKTEAPAFKGSTGYGYAYGLVYSPDGKQLATVGLDNRVLLWDVATEKVIWQWASNEVIASIALASDGRHLAVNLQTGVIYVLRWTELR